MKIVYQNKAMNKQKNPSPSLKTLMLVSALVVMMVAIKVFYNPTDSIEDVAAMANITGETIAEETTEIYDET